MKRGWVQVPVVGARPIHMRFSGIIYEFHSGWALSAANFRDVGRSVSAGPSFVKTLLRGLEDYVGEPPPAQTVLYVLGNFSARPSSPGLPSFCL